MKDEKDSIGDRLEKALQESKQRKRAAAASAVKMAPELKRLAALHKKLEALPPNERRKVLDAAGLRHVSAAPKPITPLRGSSCFTPPSRPPELLAMAMTKAATNLMSEPQAAPLNDEVKTFAGRELVAVFTEPVNNAAPLNWRYWVSQLPTLATAEAARLMCGLDPHLFKSLESCPNKNDQSNPCKKAAMIQKLAEREGKESATPGEWISWAGEHQIAVHNGFRLDVESEPAKSIATLAPVVSTSDAPAPLNTTIHSTKARRDTLTPVIELAQSKCRNPHDTAEVWAALQVLAETKTAPLIGGTEEGLQYLKGGIAEIFKRKSLGKRLAR